MPDLNANTVEAAMSMIAGSARSTVASKSLTETRLTI